VIRESLVIKIGLTSLCTLYSVHKLIKNITKTPLQNSTNDTLISFHGVCNWCTKITVFGADYKCHHTDDTVNRAALSKHFRETVCSATLEFCVLILPGQVYSRVEVRYVLVTSVRFSTLGGFLYVYGAALNSFKCFSFRRFLKFFFFIWQQNFLRPRISNGHFI